MQPTQDPQLSPANFHIFSIAFACPRVYAVYLGLNPHHCVPCKLPLGHFIKHNIESINLTCTALHSKLVQDTKAATMKLRPVSCTCQAFAHL